METRFNRETGRVVNNTGSLQTTFGKRDREGEWKRRKGRGWGEGPGKRELGFGARTSMQLERTRGKDIGRRFKVAETASSGKCSHYFIPFSSSLPSPPLLSTLLLSSLQLWESFLTGHPGAHTGPKN